MRSGARKGARSESPLRYASGPHPAVAECDHLSAAHSVSPCRLATRRPGPVGPGWYEVGPLALGEPKFHRVRDEHASLLRAFSRSPMGLPDGERPAMEGCRQGRESVKVIKVKAECGRRSGERAEFSSLLRSFEATEDKSEDTALLRSDGATEGTATFHTLPAASGRFRRSFLTTDGPAVAPTELWRVAQHRLTRMDEAGGLKDQRTTDQGVGGPWGFRLGGCSLKVKLAISDQRSAVGSRR